MIIVYFILSHHYYFYNSSTTQFFHSYQCNVICSLIHTCLQLHNFPNTTFESFLLLAYLSTISSKLKENSLTNISSPQEQDQWERQDFQLAVRLIKASFKFVQVQEFMCLCLKVCLCCGEMCRRKRGEGETQRPEIL